MSRKVCSIRNRNHERCDVERSESDRDRDNDRSHERGDRDRESRRYKHSGRDHGRDHDRSGRDHDGYRHSSSRRSRSRSRSRSQSHSIIDGTDSDHQPKPFREENKDKTKVVSSNLTKLKDLYGDASERKSEEPADGLRKDTSSEEVGGFTWKWSRHGTSQWLFCNIN